jgi:MtN3 and saliva related transmembrane protein
MTDTTASDLVGWASALILLLTVSSQVWKQWRSKSSAGVSQWLFIGQISASFGFVIYSFAVDNLVFVFTNSLLLLAAIVGQCLYLHNRRRERDGGRSQQRTDQQPKDTPNRQPVTSSSS